MKWIKKIFGGKPEDPLLTNQDKSVPDEKNVFDKMDKEELKPFDERFRNMDIVQPEEPIAPTLERQDDVVDDKKGFEVDYSKSEFKGFLLTDKEGKRKIVTPKKKDNRNPDDDRKSWPNSNSFTL